MTTATLRCGTSAHGSRLLGLRVPAPGRRVAFSDDGRTLIVAGGRVVRVVDVASRSGDRRSSPDRQRQRRALRRRRHVRDSDDRPEGSPSGRDRGSSCTRSTAARPHVVAVALSPDGRLVAAREPRRHGDDLVDRVRPPAAPSARAPARRSRTWSSATTAASSPPRRSAATRASGTVSDGSADPHPERRINGRVARVAFSPDDQWLITAGPNNGRPLADLERQAALLSPRTHESAGGRRLCSGRQAHRHRVRRPHRAHLHVRRCAAPSTSSPGSRHQQLVHIPRCSRCASGKRYLGG